MVITIFERMNLKLKETNWSKSDVISCQREFSGLQQFQSVASQN